ncbi:MAG TPA: sensor histidine kinase, partial [Daejeonella sp.]|nr:sensor histidine kinase [Daejeonella sp.]
IMVGYLIYNRRKIKAQALLRETIHQQQNLAALGILDAEERERRRIASELHDGVGQTLSCALMNFNNLFSDLSLNHAYAVQAERAVSLLSESYDEMRSISHQMIPHSLMKAGLASAVREFLQKIDQKNIRVQLEVNGLDNRLNEQVETALYRITQEAVNNVIKHARASRLAIQLIKDEEGISLSIEDNGQGFDKSKLAHMDGIGLKNIYSRIGLLKGTVDLESAPGKGTLLMIHLPV